MNIIKTQYPIGGIDPTFPEEVIFKHIEKNIDKYSDIDGSLIDFTIYGLMIKPYPHHIVQLEINNIIKNVEYPIFLINFDKSDEFYNFGMNSKVFTPEATYGRDNFFGIPRQSLMVDDGVEYERNILFSFRGANRTHSRVF